ncbi:hypothetical protein PL321_07345 [Caloramator sp. mosi_1]|uniref:HMA2 domain-containing protein n=1 Tax=Caloramator sp. mosi_1 TaxID=3023090 RepID=UPI0023625271|nr:hypothetical protein [Caloramator sp. mosi_1]WDC85258.1 hypothetical protein PL321_07345 [Caloramator sp. mosi_1]
MKAVEKIFSIPGRLRLKVWEIYNDYGAACSIRTNLYSVDGIKSIKFNIYNCSILVLYDETKLDEDTIYCKVVDTKLSTHKINLKSKSTISILTDDLAPYKLLKNPFYKKFFLFGLALELFYFFRLSFKFFNFYSYFIKSNNI